MALNWILPLILLMANYWVIVLSLQGDVDIVNAKGEFIELDYEGFILEFTVAVVKDSLRRFISSYSTRHLREYFPSHSYTLWMYLRMRLSFCSFSISPFL